ncbi:hypothetical protein SUDANB121_02611 [Nocardiopsis dassonvillei]|uniref:hypothetical protein n=1 Tax=Nocardiopsis dassonvillei TaxID=2014 RepID=UPI003F5735D3
MSRTSRTARAPRAAAVVRTPSLLLLPLLVGAALAALWLVGAPSAHADTAGPLGLDRSGASLDTGLARGLEPSLEGGVAEVAAPVTETLGTVHRRLEERTGPDSATVLSDPSVTEVGEGVHEGARRVVRELAAVDRDQAENLVAHVASTRVLPAEPEETEPAPAGGTGTPRPASDRGERDGDGAGAREARGGGVRAAEPGFLPQHHPAGAVAEAAPVDEHRTAASADRDASAPGAPKLSTGSTAPSGAGAPAVAGYLTVVPLTAPAADALSTAVDAVHPVPAGPADDPTVSPD